MPYELDQYVNDQASRVPMPPDFIAVTVLTALSAVLGARVAIKPKQLDDFSIVPNLWGGFIAPPSSKKSGALKSGITPLDRLVAQARQAHAEELKAFQAQEIMSKANETVLKKQVGETVQKDGLNSEKGRVLAAQLVEQQVSDSNKPVLMRYSTNDSSPEALSELEITRPNGILVVRDELVGLLATLDKEGNESARTYYLEGWNGDSSYQVDRIMRGDKFIQNHCLSVMGGIQPDKLIKYLEPCINGLGNDGLIQRFQLLVYPDPIPWDYRDHPLNKDARDSVFTLFKKIENLTDIDLVKMGALPADDNNKRPYFRFSDQAQAYYIQWVTQLEKEKIANEEHSIIIEHLSKYNKLMPALALIFHVIDCIAMPKMGGVSLQAAEMAGAWCDYLESHARRIYGLVLDNRRYAATLSMKLKYVCKSSRDNTHNWMTDGFTARQVRQKNWKGLTDQKTIQDAIEILIDENWLSFEETFPSAAGGRPSITYFINPKILE